MMRPMVFQVPSTMPAAPVLSVASVGGNAQLTWTDGTPFDYTTWTPATTVGNPANEVGFKIMRGTGLAGPLTQIALAGANSTVFADPGAASGTYRYQVIAFNAAGSATSNIVSLRVEPIPPAAPSSLTGTAVVLNGRSDRVTLTFTDNSINETGFDLQRATNAAFTRGVSNNTVPAAPGSGTTVTVAQNGVSRGRTYWWRVRAVNAAGPSAWSNTFSMTTP